MFPEHTALAYKEAAKQGADLIECDLAITKVILNSLKGILHQKIFYRLNLIFWIVMGCDIARFGRRGLKTTET